MNKKNFLIALCFVLFSLLIQAQNKYNTKISGEIIDSTTKKPIEYVSIAIYKAANDSLVAGTLSDGKGKFKKENIPYGAYKLKLTFVGYNDNYISNIVLSPKTSIIDLKQIFISESTKELNTVSVVGQRKGFEQTFDKKIFTMDEKRTPGALTVLDQLKTLPSITVDNDGNVKFRGQTPNILVDDQPYTLLYPKLEMIPASNVDKIEFIDPSAKYASSVGTINIKLKQPKENGLSGAVYTSWGTYDFKKLSSSGNGFNVNYKYKNLIVYSNLNVYTNSMYNNYNISKISFEDTSRKYIYSDSRFDYNSLYLSGSSGAIYNFNKKTKLTFSWTPSFNESKHPNYKDLLDTNIKGVRSIERNEGDNLYKNFGNSFVLNFNKKLSSDEHVLSIKSTFSLKNSSAEYDDILKYKYYNYEPIDSLRTIYTKDPEQNKRFSINIEYKVPLDTTGRIEVGLQSDYKMQGSEYQYFLNENEVKKYYNKDDIKELNVALYGNLGKKFKKFKIDLGTRFEIKNYDFEVIYNVSQKDTVVTLNKTYPYIIPNLTLGYEIKPFHELKFTYQLDSQVPQIYQLNPFESKSNSRYWSSGNKDLKIYNYHRFSLGYMYAPEKFSISADIFTFFSNNYIEWVERPINNNEILFSKPENVGKNQGTGVNISGSFMPAEWVNGNLSMDIFQSEIISEIEKTKSSKTTTFTGNAYVSFILNKKNSLSLYVNYYGNEASLGGYTKGTLWNGIYYSRKFLDNKLSLNFSINNLIEPETGWYTNQNYLGKHEINENYGSWLRRSFRISLRYTFNKGDRGLLKTENQDNGGGMPSGNGR